MNSDQQSFEQRMRELDREGLAAIRDACLLYHRKHSSGIGGAAICPCGAGGGGSSACRGLRLLRDFFQRSDLQVNPEWQPMLELIQEVLS